MEDSSTVAFGINVPKALGDFLVLEAVRETGGTAVAVEDADLLADLALTARLEGMFLCPEGAATVTAARQLARTGWLSPDDEVVLLNTGRRRDLPRHRHGRRPDDRQGRRAGAVTGRRIVARSCWSPAGCPPSVTKVGRIPGVVLAAAAATALLTPLLTGCVGNHPTASGTPTASTRAG